MAKSLSKPWILDSIVDLLNDSKRKEKFTFPAKVVQVIKANYELGYLVLSDTKHSITAFFTPDERRRLEREGRNSQETLNELKNTLIRLEKDAYIFSTVPQCASDRGMSNITNCGITLPMALHCNRIMYFSAHDTGIMGEPNDVNSDPKFSNIRNTFRYSELLGNLTLRQYPNERCLPDCNGQFLIPPRYDPTNPIIAIQHCLISDDQKDALDRIDIFDSFAISATKTTAPSTSILKQPMNNVEVEKKVIEEIPSQNLGRGARKRTQTQFFTQSLEFTQPDDDSMLISQTGTNDTMEEDDDAKLSFFTQPGAEQTQDYIHGLTAMMPTQPEEPIDKLVGRTVKKFFPGYGWFEGIVSKRNGKIYEILYTDGDREGMIEENLRSILVSNDPTDNMDKSIDDTVSQNINKIKEVTKRKDSTKTPAQQAIRKENVSNKRIPPTPKETKSKLLFYYNHPDVKKILNSLHTSKYLPCGFDENGKVSKALRVIP